MDTLHNVLRSMRETKSKPDHLSVFREFLDHLDRAARRAAKQPPPPKRTKRVKRRAKN